MSNLGKPALDYFPQSPPSISSNSPYSIAAAVATSDTVPLGFVTRALWVGGAGNVKMDLIDAAGNITTVTFTGVPAGTLLLVRCSGVYATLTTATNIVALA